MIVDLESLGASDKFRVNNKPSRADELEDLRQKVIQENFLTARRAEQARGRVTFAKSFNFGRVGGRCSSSCLKPAAEADSAQRPK